MRRAAFIRHLEQQGCRLRREGSKHSIYENPVRKTTSTVPRHTELNDFLVKKICRDLGIASP